MSHFKNTSANNSTYSFYSETERLLIREMRVEDAESFYLLNADMDVLKHTGDVPFKDIQESSEFLCKYPEISYLKDGYGRWTCIEKKSNVIIGWCGLRLQPDGETDLGYRFHKRFWNQGYATESGRFSLIYGFRSLGLNRIIARAHKDNIGSWRVMEKLNMTFIKIEDDKNKLYEIKSDEI